VRRKRARKDKGREGTTPEDTTPHQKRSELTFIIHRHLRNTRGGDRPMMTGTITDDQARALAQLVSLLSGDKRWDVAGVRAALSKARRQASAPDLAIAAIRCAVNPEARTPAVIGMDGPHWVAVPFAGGRETRPAKCPTHGIAVRLVDGLCTGCVADTKAADDNRDDTLAVSPDQAETNARGARTVLRAIHTARTTRTKEQDQ